MEKCHSDMVSEVQRERVLSETVPMKFVFDKNYRFLALDQRGMYNSMDDKKYLERKYESIFNIKLDLENPRTFNQKIVSVGDDRLTVCFEFLQIIDYFRTVECFAVL